MNKIVIILLLLFTTLIAKSYHFKEIRYSDALAKSITLHGVISFVPQGLNITYDKSKRSLHYENEELELFDNGKLVALDENESAKIMQYFELIMMLNAGDKATLEAAFNIQNTADKEILSPKNELKNYIKRVDLTREKTQLKSLEFFLINDDTISISIENEVR